MTTIERIVKRYYDGDPLTNDQLLALHDHCSRASAALWPMGERFRLAWQASHDAEEKTLYYIKNRGLTPIADEKIAE